MQNIIECTATGLVYHNPKPYLRSVHAWHPTVVRMEDGTLVCAFDLGQAVESLDYGSYVARSSDGGRTWSPPVPLFIEIAKRLSTHAVRISRMRDNTVVGWGARFFRDEHPDEGLTNRANLGY